MTELPISLGILLFILTLVLICILLFIDATTKQNSVPGPWNLPILGYIPFLSKNPHLKLTYLAKQYGSVFSLRMGSQQVVVLNGYETIKAALNDRATDFAGRPQYYIFKLLNREDGIGLLDYGKEWKTRRKITVKGLNMFSSVKDHVFHNTLTNACHSLVEVMINSNSDGYNPTDDILIAVGQVISSICFGKEFGKYDQDYLSLMQRMSEFSRVANGVNVVNYLPWTRIFFRNVIQKAIDRDNGMKELCKKLLQPHIESYEQECLRGTADALLRAACQMQNEGDESAIITDNQILGIVHELMSAGFATVATTLRWGLLLLAMHPEVQDLAAEEIDNLVTKSQFPTFDDRGRLPYTEATILEIQRFASIVALGVSRSTTKDIIFQGFSLSKGTIIIPNLWSLHHDPQTWIDPEKFNPSRFLNETQDAINPIQAEKIMPFGGGRRRCAGETLGRIELFMFLATLIQKCSFHEIPEKTLSTNDYNFGLVLNPKPYFISVTKRI